MTAATMEAAAYWLGYTTGTALVVAAGVALSLLAARGLQLLIWGADE